MRRISPRKYLLPYQDQLSFEDTPCRVRLSPRSLDRFSFWPFGISHTRPESVSYKNPGRVPFCSFATRKQKGTQCKLQLAIANSSNCNRTDAASHLRVLWRRSRILHPP